MGQYQKETRTELVLVYLTGLVQGIALVAFPAASSIFTRADGFGFSSTQYGAMFLPQVVLAILASGLAPSFASRVGLKRVFVVGIFSDMISMSLLAFSHMLQASPHAAYALLLIATGVLGVGFGSTIMALNTYAERWFPNSSDRAVLALNALLGTGTALAPVFVAVFLGLGAWWVFPILVACALAVLFVFALREPLQSDSSVSDGSHEPTRGFLRRLPSRFWLYAAAVFLYGIIETLNGNWATLYLTLQRSVSQQGASTALAAFWAMVTVGRIVVGIVSARVLVRLIYVGLPVLMVVAFQAISHANGETEGILAFGLAGLACSAFLPLSISFGGSEFPKLAGAVSGELIAFYQLGYGVAAFGMGPLRALTGSAFSAIFSWGSAIAVILGILALLLSLASFRKRPS